MAGKNENEIYEINVIVGDEAESKSMCESKENVSTESVNRSDSGIQTSESNVDESKIMNEVKIHSTSISSNQNKKSDDDNMLKRLYSMMSVSYTHLDVYKRQVLHYLVSSSCFVPLCCCP